MKKLFFLMITIFTLTGCSSDDEKYDNTITSIKLSKSELSLIIGEEATLNVTYSPSDLPSPKYKWSSSDDEIVTVANGKIQAHKEGKVIITVTIPESDLSSSCAVIVSPIKAKSIKLSSNNEVLEIGENTKLTYVIDPENTSYKEVEWISSDPNIATVLDGTITAVEDGECEITVQIKGTKTSDKCTITVNPIKVSGIILDKTNKTVEQNESFALIAIVQPENAKDKSLIWNSSNPSIATVQNGIVNAINKGECDITATTVDGNFKATCSVKVLPISVKSISFNENSVLILESDKIQLTYHITPNDAENQSVHFSSSDSNIASVDNDGYITANNVGNTTITVTTNDGNHSAICNVSVSPITNFVTASYNSSEVSIGGFTRISASSTIENNSTKSIKLTKFTVIDPYDGSIIAETTDQSKLGELTPSSSRNLGLNLTERKYPNFRWTYEFNNKSYTREVSHK